MREMMSVETVNGIENWMQVHTDHSFSNYNQMWSAFFLVKCTLIVKN